mgnify:CR=1 FL=1
MFKVRMFGEIDATSTCVSFDDALALLMPAVGNIHTSGDIVNMETGEVLVFVQDGDVTYIDHATVMQMLHDIAETDPEAALFLALMGLVAGAFDDEPAPAPAEEEFVPRNLLEILGKL